METNLKDIYSDKLITVRVSATLAEAEDVMNNYNIRHLPVVDAEETLVGLLSKSDFIALKTIDSRLQNYSVKTYMSSPVKVVRKNAKVQEVAQIFINKKISSVLIVDKDEAIGIVTTEDLIRLLANKPEMLTENEQLDLESLADEGWISTTSSTQTVS